MPKPYVKPLTRTWTPRCERWKISTPSKWRGSILRVGNRREKRANDVKARFGASDDALAELDRVIVALEGIRTRGGEEIEPLLERLRVLADRAATYSKTDR